MESQASPLEQYSTAAAPQGILPDEIVSYILSFLSMEEAFRTQLVCRRWRYLCIPVLNLKLNSKIIFNCRYQYYTSIKDKSELWEFESDFVRKVDMYLNKFPGKKLVSFNISFHFCFGNEFASHVDNWISFAVRMEAETISLNIPFLSSHYSFPCHLLPPGGGCHLKFLCLQGCKLGPPLEFMNRLNSLKYLQLDKACLEEGDMDVILSGCLSLESLILRECDAIKSLRLAGRVPRLKWLLVYCCYSIEVIDLNSAGLERLEYIGRMVTFNYSEIVPATKVFLWFLSSFLAALDFMFECLPGDFPLLQDLTLSWYTNRRLPLPASIASFGCLKNLHLILFLASNFDLLSVTYVLNACPVLEKFHLSLHAYPYRGGDIPKEDYSSRQYLQLKEVAINGFGRNWNAVELAMHLLKNAAALERMIINKTSGQYHGAGEWSYHDGSDLYGLTSDEIHDLLFKEKVNPTTELLII